MDQQSICACGSGKAVETCCLALHKGERFAATPLELMRSRYMAFQLQNIPYILETTLPAMRKYYPEKAVREWAASSTWLGLLILEAAGNTVRFEATYRDQKGNTHIHREHSTFQQLAGKWYFVDGADF